MSNEFSTEVEELTEVYVTNLIAEYINKEAVKIANLVRKNLKVLNKETLRNTLRERIQKVDMRFKERTLRLCSVAIDTSFTTPPLELTGGKLIIIIKGHVLYGNCSVNIPKSDAKGYVKFIQEDENIASSLSKVIERKFVVDLLEKKKKHALNFDLIIIDGELFPRIPPGYVKKRKRIGEQSYRFKLYDKIMELTEKALKLADETNTTLVGVLKRVYGNDISILLKSPEIQLNDKVIASFMLEEGEFLDLDSYADIYSRLIELLAQKGNELPGSLKRKLNERAAWLSSTIRHIDHVGSIRVTMYKGLTPAYFTLANKVEIWLSSELSYEDLMSYLSTITGVNGVPYPIDMVDSLCRITSNILFNAQQQLFCKLAEKIGNKQLAMIIAGLTNPEKMYKIGVK